MNSLKGRLILAATAWVTFGMIAASFILFEVFNHHVTKQFYDELFVHLDELERLTDWKRADGPGVTRPLSDPRYDIARSGYYWEIQKADRVLARSVSLQGPALSLPEHESTDANIHTHEISGPTGKLMLAERAIWRSAEGPPVHLIMGVDRRHLQEVFSDFRSTLAWSLTALSILMVAGSALLILYALRPLKLLRDALVQVRQKKAKQLQGPFPSEVRPLIDELNGLLASTANLIQRARTQAGNLAHGLKTPLAILVDEAHRVEKQGLPQASATIIAQCRKLQTQIDFQMARARAVSMRSVPGTIANVRRAADDVANALRRLHVARGMSISVNVPEGLFVACDPQDLNEMLANIVDNACKHARSSVAITGKMTKPNGSLCLQIDDDGNGLPDEALEVVFEVGERWNSRAAGSGLGLAIVRDLAQLYDGSVELRRSEAGGLSVLISLPSADAKQNFLDEAPPSYNHRSTEKLERKDHFET